MYMYTYIGVCITRIGGGASSNLNIVFISLYTYHMTCIVELTHCIIQTLTAVQTIKLAGVNMLS